MDVKHKTKWCNVIIKMKVVTNQVKTNEKKLCVLRRIGVACAPSLSYNRILVVDLLTLWQQAHVIAKLKCF
jgi:hypothetical protein